jgi:hypothetical protein
MKRMLYTFTTCLIMSQTKMVNAQTQPAAPSAAREAIIQQCATSAQLSIPASKNWPDLSSASDPSKKAFFTCLGQNHIHHGHYFRKVAACVRYKFDTKLPKGALRNIAALDAQTQTYVQKCQDIVKADFQSRAANQQPATSN